MAMKNVTLKAFDSSGLRGAAKEAGRTMSGVYEALSCLTTATVTGSKTKKSVQTTPKQSSPPKSGSR